LSLKFVALAISVTKTIGLLGGMSWESTESYYRLINEGIKQDLGGLHSAKILLHSFDFEEKHNIKVIIPGDADRKIIHDVIYNELCLGDIGAESRAHAAVRMAVGK